MKKIILAIAAFMFLLAASSLYASGDKNRQHGDKGQCQGDTNTNQNEEPSQDRAGNR